MVNIVQCIQRSALGYNICDHSAHMKIEDCRFNSINMHFKCMYEVLTLQER